MDNKSSAENATIARSMGSILSGAVTNVILGLIAGIVATFGLFFSPLQKVIFNFMWKEQPAVSLLLSPAKAIESDIVGIDIIVSPLNTAVGLSGGTMTLSVDGQDARLLLDNARVALQEVSEFTKVDGQKVFHKQLIATRPGLLSVKVVVKANNGEIAEAERTINVAARPIGTCKFIGNDEKNSSFQGRWHFDFNSFGSFEVDMHEGGLDKLSGEFRNSHRQTGLFEGGRDGHTYFGNFTFYKDPLKRLKVQAEYLAEGGFLTTKKESYAVLETRLNAKRFDWTPVRKESIAQGFCRLH